MSAKNVAVVTMSTRTPRVGPEVAKLVHDFIADDAAAHSVTLTSIDLDDFKLPIYDEQLIPAMVPAMGTYQHEHTKKWSAAMAAPDGYVLVIPEYNYGVAGATKNAVDYLYNEWIGKPVLIVSYGIKGGTLASEALAKSLECMKLRVVKSRPALAFAKGPEPGDMMVAITKGALGDETKKAWLAQKDEILEAFGQLKTELVGEVAAEVPAEAAKDAAEKA